MAYGGSTNANTNILSGETFDFVCAVCKHKGKSCKAERYCRDCLQYYCLSCVKGHEDSAFFTDHRIIGRGQFPSSSAKKQSTSRDEVSRSIETPFEELSESCERHRYNCVDKYCQRHDAVGCDTCMVEDHCYCRDIFYIPEYLSQETVKTSTRDIQRKLKTAIKTLREQDENLKKEKQRHMHRRKTVLYYIKKCRNEINDRLDQLEEFTIAATEDKYKDLLHEIEEEIKVIESASVKQNQAQCRKTTSEIFVKRKTVEALAKSAAKTIERSKSFKSSSVYFTPDPQLLFLLNEMTGLGSLEKEMSSQAEMMGATNFLKESDLHKVSGSKKHSVKVHSDQVTSDIVSACTLEDGTILLSDYNNKKLKQLHSTTYTVIDYCDLPGEPWQVCSVDKQQAAVCLPNKQEVRFISLNGKMKSSHEKKAPFNCYGLACAGDNLYISDNYTSIYIYSIYGGLLNRFSEYQQFSDISSLAVNQFGSLIYVCDLNNGLIILDDNGRYFESNNQMLRCAYDSYLASEGSLLVCGRTSNNVLQFDTNGELIGEVVKFDDEIKLQAVCCNQQMSKMIIGKNWHDKIEVFDLV